MAKDKKSQAGTGRVPDGPSSKPIGATMVKVDEHGYREGFCDYQHTTTPCGVIGTLGGLDAPPGMAGGSKQRNESLRQNPFQKPGDGKWDALKGEGEDTDEAQRKAASLAGYVLRNHQNH